MKKIKESLDIIWKNFQQVIKEQNHTDLEASFLAGRLFQHVILTSIGDDKEYQETFDEFFVDLRKKLHHFVILTLQLIKEREAERNEQS